jgi:hypothetical protein
MSETCNVLIGKPTELGRNYLFSWHLASGNGAPLTDWERRMAARVPVVPPQRQAKLRFVLVEIVVADKQGTNWKIYCRCSCAMLVIILSYALMIAVLKLEHG